MDFCSSGRPRLGPEAQLPIAIKIKGLRSISPLYLIVDTFWRLNQNWFGHDKQAKIVSGYLGQFLPAEETKIESTETPLMVGSCYVSGVANAIATSSVGCSAVLVTCLDVYGDRSDPFPKPTEPVGSRERFGQLENRPVTFNPSPLAP